MRNCISVNVFSIKGPTFLLNHKENMDHDFKKTIISLIFILNVFSSNVTYCTTISDNNLNTNSFTILRRVGVSSSTRRMGILRRWWGVGGFVGVLWWGSELIAAAARVIHAVCIRIHTSYKTRYNIFSHFFSFWIFIISEFCGFKQKMS